MRVIHETTIDCNKCLYNRDRVCLKLGKFLFDICFERDCPLPFLNDIKNKQQLRKDDALKVLSFDEFLKKYSYKRSDEIIAYELYLILEYLKRNV